MDSILDSGFFELLETGGDFAIFGVLYYAHSINSRIALLESKYRELKGWVNRLDARLTRRDTNHNGGD